MSTSALAPAIAAIVTNPADVAKTRLNMERELRPGRIGSVVGCWRRIYAAEGLAGLQRGLGFVLIRESSKNAFRLGLYDPLVGALHSGSSGSSGSSSNKQSASGAPMSVRVVAGMLSGGVSALIANPLDLLKTRLQLEPSREAGRTAGDALRTFVDAEGVSALWRRGALANISRSALATSLALPANSKFKEWIAASRLPVKPAVRDATAALLASLFVVVAINPIDLVRTRLFSSPTAGHSPGSGAPIIRYDGVLHCLRRVVETEGVGALWKGVTASFLRIGPHQVLTFTILGVLQRYARSKGHK